MAEEDRIAGLEAQVERLRAIIANVSACYEGRFDRGGAHVFFPADVWNAVKDEEA